MDLWEEYARRLEADIAEFQKDLAPLESGEMRLKERIGNGPWVDTTQREIAWHKKTIAALGAILAKVRRDHPEILRAEGVPSR